MKIQCMLTISNKHNLFCNFKNSIYTVKTSKKYQYNLIYSLISLICFEDKSLLFSKFESV